MKSDYEFIREGSKRGITARKSEPGWGSKNAKTPGWSILDPHFRLGYAIVKNAVDELRDTDPVKFFDALCWLLEDAEDWLDFLNLYSLDDGRYFNLLIQSEVGKNG